MTKITPDLIKRIITQNGSLFVPESITDAIGSCLVSSDDAIREEGDKLKETYDKFATKLEPIVVDYSGDVTIDAYSVYYLPRNMLVPKVAILCCAYDAAFQNLPNRLSVLDLGSGTGAVVLGLLDLFHNKALLGIHLDIVALDSSLESLNRQSKLVEHLGIHDSSHKWQQVDLSDPVSYQSKLPMGAPYDMVFAANIFTELKEQPTDELIKCVAPLLSENGIIVSVESQSNYAMRQRARIVKTAKNLGLHMYYPCPPELSCPKRDCWMWRTDEFDCPCIMVNGQAIDTTKVHRAHWTIVCKKPCTIYDALHNKNPDLIWGIAAPYKPKFEGDKVKHGYEFCTERGRLTGTITQDQQKWMWLMRDELFDRGSVIGITADLKEIQEGWDIVSGFVSY